MQDDTVTTSQHNPFPPLSDALNFRVAERPISWHNLRTDKHVLIPEEKALVRAVGDSGQWMANVGKGFKVVHNNQLFPYAEERMLRVIDPKFHHNVTVIEHVSYNGRDCYREYRFHDLRCNVKHGDVAFRVIVGNSYGHKAVTLLSGAIDFFCTNGMLVGSAEKQAKRHTANFEVTGLDTWIENSVSQFAAHGTRIERYDNTDIPVAAVDKLFAHLEHKGVLSKRMCSEITEGMYRERTDRRSKMAKPTMWDLYSALTAWASHGEVRNTANDHEANTRIERAKHAERVIRAADAFMDGYNER